MANYPTEHPESVDAIALTRVVLDALERPALLVQAPDTIVVANAAWRRLFTDSARSHVSLSLLRWLDMLEGGDVLAAALDAAMPRRARVGHDVAGVKRQFDVRVLPAPELRFSGVVHLLTMADVSLPAVPEGSSATDDYTHRLLVRQTLIEERERRRLGQALHDQVTQLLVQLRRQLTEVRDGRDTLDCVSMISDVDRVIDVLRELTFAFSPPVLEDLGLLPAMHWLADHLRQSYGVAVSCEDDGVEPPISPDVRTIAFRAVRELANNAVKHAPGSSISLISRVEDEYCRLEVTDDGPGFNEADSQRFPQPLPGYGLLSIEQQIRSVGGKFEISSARGSGTSAIITLHTVLDIEYMEADHA